MPNRRLHYIDHAGLTTYRLIGGAMRQERYFEANDEGVAHFADWLRQGRAGGIHTLFVDLPDEGFHYETVPHVIGGDRRALIQRKLSQHFFGSPYSAALSLGRETTGRRDDRILFTALTRPALLDPWLNALRNVDAAISSLHTPPLLTSQLLRALKISSPRGLIILLTSAGIRQIYFEDGKLRFARLSPGPEAPFSEWGLDCLREAQKTYQYLSGQRWMARGSELPVWLVGHAHDLPVLLGNLNNANLLSFNGVDINSACQQIGLRDRLASSDARPLLIHIAQREHRAPQLAPESARRYFRLWQVRAGLIATGCVVFAACALLSTKYVVDARELRQEALELQRDAQNQSIRYNTLLASLPALPSSLESLRSAVDNYEAIAKSNIGPLLALQRLARGLEAFPEIQLQRLEWQLVDWAGDSETEPVSVATRQAILITARLPEALDSDPRSAITQIQSFASALRAADGNEVSVVKLPFDVESNKTLRSEQTTMRQPEFQVRLLVSVQTP